MWGFQISSLFDLCYFFTVHVSLCLLSYPWRASVLNSWLFSYSSLRVKRYQINTLDNRLHLPFSWDFGFCIRFQIPVSHCDFILSLINAIDWSVVIWCCFPGLTGNSVLSTYCVLLLCRVNLKSKWLLHFGGSQSSPAANSFLESLLLLPATFALFSMVLIFMAFFPYLFLPSLFSPSLFLAYFLLGIFFLPPSSNNCGACLHQLTIM